MTEEEWLASRAPRAMLAALEGLAKDGNLSNVQQAFIDQDGLIGQ